MLGGPSPPGFRVCPGCKQVRTRGIMDFNLDGGDAALVETAVETTLVTRLEILFHVIILFSLLLKLFLFGIGNWHCDSPWQCVVKRIWSLWFMIKTKLWQIDLLTYPCLTYNLWNLWNMSLAMGFISVECRWPLTTHALTTLRQHGLVLRSRMITTCALRQGLLGCET